MWKMLNLTKIIILNVFFFYICCELSFFYLLLQNILNYYRFINYNLL
jgi:hypothetical protein